MKKIILIFIVLFGFINQAGARTITTKEVVDSRPVFALYPKSSLVDESGVIHSAYAGDSMYYATLDTKVEEGWTVQTIDDASGLRVEGLDVDSLGVSHILAWDFSDNTWYYIYGNLATGWSKEEIEALRGFAHDWQYITLRVNNTTGILSIIYRNDEKDLIHLTYSSGSWESEVIAPEGFEGNISSSNFRIDASGFLHVICSDNTKKEIYYLTNSLGPWTVETVLTGDRLYAVDLVLGSDSKVHAVYTGYDSSSRSYILYSLENTSDAWVREGIDSSSSNFSRLAVGLDESDLLHVIYVSDAGTSGYSLNHAVRVGSAEDPSWTGETIDLSSVPTSYGLSISGFGFTEGEAQVIISSSLEPQTYRVYGSFGSWEVEVIDSSNRIGFYTSTDVDPSSNSIHTAYKDFTNGNLLYATNETGVWNTEIIDSEENVGTWPSIKVDSSGQVHVCYYDSTNEDLKYAVRTDKVWSIETVDSDGDVGEYCSLAVSSDGVVHISYADFSDNAVNHAFGNKGAWSIEKVYSSANKSSIKIDKANKVHISLFGNVRYTYRTDVHSYIYYYDLIHAEKEDGTWAFETIESLSSEKANLTVHLEIDESDFAHIVYSLWDGFLKYSTNQTGSWVIDEIDTGDDIYTVYSDFKMDPQGYGHILYRNEYNGYFKYAHGYSGVWKVEDFDDRYGENQSLGMGLDGVVHFIYRNDILNTLYHEATTYCDGTVDEENECDDGNRIDGDGCSALCEVETLYYLDEDGDGYGNETSAYFFTSPLSGYTEVSGDCDDATVLASPGAAEICGNGKDDDCDGSFDEECPVTGSGTSSDSTTGDPSTTGEGSGSGDSSSTGEETTGGDSSSTSSGETSTTGSDTFSDSTTGDSSATGEGTGSTENGTTDGATESGTTGEEGSSSSSTSSDGSSSSTGSDTSGSSEGSSTTTGGTDAGNPNEPIPPPTDGNAAKGSGGCSLRI